MTLLTKAKYCPAQNRPENIRHDVKSGQSWKRLCKLVKNYKFRRKNQVCTKNLNQSQNLFLDSVLVNKLFQLQLVILTY